MEMQCGILMNKIIVFSWSRLYKYVVDLRRRQTLPTWGRFWKVESRKILVVLKSKNVENVKYELISRWKFVIAFFPIRVTNYHP